MILLIMLPLAMLAQGPACPRAAGDTAALALSDVERRPVADSANAPPRYPELLRQAEIGGAVRVSFTVDTAGHVEPASIRIVRTPNAGFDQAVKRAVTPWRYAPASLCGHAVRVRFAHEFAFRASPIPRDTLRLAQVFDIEPSVTSSTDTLADGTPSTTVGWRPTTWVVDSPPWDAVVLDSAEEAALAHVVADLGPAPSDMTRIVCLAGKDGPASDPDSARLTRLARGGIAVLPSRRCPKTFASMIYTPGERPHPPGEDPFGIAVRTRRVLSPTRAFFDIDVSQGNGGNRYRCGVERRDSGWRVRCALISSWVS